MNNNYNENNINLSNKRILTEILIIGTIAVGKSTIISKLIESRSEYEKENSKEILIEETFYAYLYNRIVYSDDFQLLMMMWAELRRKELINICTNDVYYIERPLIENELFALLNLELNFLKREWIDTMYYPQFKKLKKNFENNNNDRKYLLLFNKLENCIERFVTRENSKSYDILYFEKLYEYYFYFYIDLIKDKSKQTVLLNTNRDLNNINEDYIKNLKEIKSNLLKIIYNKKHNIRFVIKKPKLKSIRINNNIQNLKKKNNLNYYLILQSLFQQKKVILSF